MSDFAYLTLTLSEDAPVRIHINGFPRLEGIRPARMQWMDILNLFLVRDNRLVIEILPPDQATVSARLRLSRHAPGSIVGSGSGQAIRAIIVDANGEGIAQDEDGSFTLAGALPIRVEARFPGFGPDFDSRLNPERSISPDQALQLGLAALQALERGNLDGVLSLMAPLLQDMALVWQEPVSQVRAALREELAEIARGMPSAGTEYSLSVQPVGPLVTVLRDGGPLIQSKDRSMTMPATFGWVGNGMALVR